MGEEPAVAIGNVNEQLCEGNDAGMFVTVWTAVIDIVTGDGVEVNAGHEYPAVYRKGGKFELIKTKHSPAVAVMEGMRFKQSEFHLDPGDMVFMYTDGATEATNAENQLFGEQRLTDALNRHLDLEPKDLLPAMRKEIDAFVADAPQFDDLTMLCMTFRGKKQ
jgi:sigma-B regulation protein RsbU (phosphoserine phosphatase)